MPARPAFPQRASHGAPQVVAVDTNPIARHAWASFIDCLYGKPPLKMPVSLQRIIDREDGFAGRIPRTRLLQRTAQQYLAVRALWQAAIYRMENESIPERDRQQWAAATGKEPTGFISPKTTHEMHRCVAPIVFVKPKAIYRTCKTLICPWCHLRRSVRILTDIPNKKDYCFVGFRTTAYRDEFPASELKRFTHHIEKLRRRCRTYVRSIFVAPEKDGWRLCGAVFCRREDAPAGVKWRRPRSFAEILRYLNPYPTTYLTAKGERLIELLNGMHGLAPVTKSRGVDYGLNPLAKGS